MRLLCAIGFITFAYLALIPAGLISATVDPSCSGESCEPGWAGAGLLVVVYALCTLALADAALRFVLYAARPSDGALGSVGRSLARAAAAVGVVLFALLALAYPVAAAALAVVGALSYLTLSRRRRPQAPDPRANGHGRLG